MYDRTFWKDHIVDEDTSEVLQQGTLQDAEHFNNEEEGIHAGNETAAYLAEQMGKMSKRVESAQGEVVRITLTNTQAYPFNNSKKSVSLSHYKTNTNYLVQPEVVSYSGGGVGDIEITDKLLNGFKIAHTGAAKTVVLDLHISGGE